MAGDQEAYFEANGPSNNETNYSAFFVTNQSGSSDRDYTFGANTQGKICGVYGESVIYEANNPNPEHRDPRNPDRWNVPTGVGIFGRGDLHGMYAASWAVAPREEPDLSAFPRAQRNTAMVGANGDATAPDSPAILGINGISNSDIEHPSFFNTAVGGVVRQASGVTGLSRDGIGVLGVSLDVPPGQRVPHPNQDIDVETLLKEPIEDPLGQDNADTPVLSAGVTGFSTEGISGTNSAAPAVRGMSAFDRGGLFQSGALLDADSLTTAPVAQIRLVPFRLNNVGPGAAAPLPKLGQVGDLLAVAYPNVDMAFGCDLWFCVRTGVVNGNAARWVQIVSRNQKPVDGTL